MMKSIKSVCLQNKVGRTGSKNLSKEDKVVIEDEWDAGVVNPTSIFLSGIDIKYNDASSNYIDLIHRPQNGLPCIQETFEENYITPRKQFGSKFDFDDIIATYRNSTTYLDPNIIETEIDEPEVPNESEANHMKITAPINFKRNIAISQKSKSAPEIKKQHRRCKAITNLELYKVKFSHTKKY